ncbi:MAG: hypothetical protein ACD_23C00595G0001 [uncultured bacterium]|nr:MAG: hypothetical protein ACD_23C00595G0001 [uncultured bacterium]
MHTGCISNPIDDCVFNGVTYIHSQFVGSTKKIMQGAGYTPFRVLNCAIRPIVNPLDFIIARLFPVLLIKSDPGQPPGEFRVFLCSCIQCFCVILHACRSSTTKKGIGHYLPHSSLSILIQRSCRKRDATTKQYFRFLSLNLLIRFTHSLCIRFGRRSQFWR